MKKGKSIQKKPPEQDEQEPLTKDEFLKFLKQVTRTKPKASPDSGKKHRGHIIPVRIAKSVLIDVHLKVFRRYPVMHTVDRILDLRPKAFNALSVDIA